MTVETSTNKSGPYALGGGALIFRRDFKVVSEDHVKVLRLIDDVETEITTGFTQTGIGEDEGAVIFTAATVPLTGNLWIVRSVPNTQESDYSNQSRVQPERIEQDLDLVVMQLQDLKEEVGRTLKVPISRPGVGVVVPGDAETIVWDEETQSFVPGPTLGDIAELKGDAERAAASAALAQAWAESPTPPDPDDPTSESAKTAAERAAASADEAALYSAVGSRALLMEMIDREVAAGDDITLYWRSWQRDHDYPTPSPVDPDEAERLANMSRVIMRVEQMAAVTWTAIHNVPGANAAAAPILAGTEFEGPPYSSVRTLGRTVGQDISIQTFADVLTNPAGIMYTDNLATIAAPLMGNWPAGAGRAVYGAVCSNFLSYGFNWTYSPVTSQISREWWRWGFTGEIIDFTIDDVEVGDIVITKGGGHIEMIVGKTAASVTSFDQAYFGPTRATRSHAHFMAYAAGRDYKLLKYDYLANPVAYTPNQYAPIRNEEMPPPVFNSVLKLDRGNVTNYAPGQDVKFNVLATDVASLIIRRNGDLVETIPTSGGTVITRAFTTAGEYSATCGYADGSESDAALFMVASVSGSVSSTTIPVGSTYTVSFAPVNCSVDTIMLEEVERYTLSTGTITYLTDDDRSVGAVVITAPESVDPARRQFRVRIRATNAFGAVFNEPLDGLIVTFTG